MEIYIVVAFLALVLPGFIFLFHMLFVEPVLSHIRWRRYRKNQNHIYSSFFDGTRQVTVQRHEEGLSRKAVRRAATDRGYVLVEVYDRLGCHEDTFIKSSGGYGVSTWQSNGSPGQPDMRPAQRGRSIVTFGWVKQADGLFERIVRLDPPPLIVPLSRGGHS